MPIFSYFAVAGTVLLGLLFAVDTTLAPPAVRPTSNFSGLPPAMTYAGGGGSAPPLVSTPAPEPDMNSPAVLAAASQPAVAATPSADAAMAQAAKPAKRKHIARRPQDHRYSDPFAFDRPWQDNRRWAARSVSPWSTWR